MKLHELIREYYPQYYSIEHYPAKRTVALCKVADEWGIFSNFASTPIEYEGITFDCGERLFHYLKFHSDAAEGKAELMAAHGGQALKMRMKHIAKAHPEWLREDWGAVVVDIMKHCLLLKYQQSPVFRNALEQSKGRYIVEDQTSFPIKEANTWGTKLVGDEYIGPNLLGRLLMELRENPEKFAQGIAHMKL